MLRFLSGKTHKVITGCCISKGTESVSFHEESYVTFFELSENEISDYVDKGLADGKAGAYGIQDNGALFVQKIEGDYYNIVGLPIARLNREIQQFLEEEK
jgi:septum formation protein